MTASDTRPETDTVSEFTSLEAAADCIEATNTPESATLKQRFAQRLRKNSIEILALDSIEQDVRRQLAACRFIRNAMREQS